ncbi:MAG TPA: hypothetical protein DEQ61_13195 [Streptomyces sp.]|nr:hypothetical protein [Streptomyces sp.]
MAVELWVVAQIKSFDAEGWALDWDLGGVFSTEDKARAACSEPRDAMWPVTLDTFLGRETVEPPDVVYPAAPQTD